MIADHTLRGLLQDQESALEMLFAHVREERPLSGSAIREWHALLTRHQDTAVGVDPFGNRVEIPLVKGQWIIRSNNPRRPDGVVHEYCPPEQVQSEIDRFLDLLAGHANLNLAQEIEAAWLRHEFVRIYPFQDGNGRVARLLMAFAYAKAGEFPPIIGASEKQDYIDARNAADRGCLHAFGELLGERSALRGNAAALRGENILDGSTTMLHGNGGVTGNGTYYPPENPSMAPATAMSAREEVEPSGLPRRPRSPSGFG